jgi:hypothetical protein
MYFNGYSMYPFLKPGDRMVVRRVPPNAFEMGDIVVAPGSANKLTAHRIVKILPHNKAILKGDSLLKTDPDPIALSNILGRVDAIIRKARLINISIGPRARWKRLHAWLSLRCLTMGALKLKGKNLLRKCFPIAKSTNIQKGMHFITSVISGPSSEINPNPDWRIIFNLAVREGVAGLLYHQLKNKDIPESFLNSLKGYYQRIAALNLIYIKALEQVEDALKNEGIKVLVLKGASLLDIFYPGIGMRPMDDIDLLVRPQNLERFSHTLSLLGYQRDSIIHHVFNKQGITMDIHVHALNVDRITSRAALFPRGMEPVWRESLPWRNGYYWLRRPNDIDNVFLLFQHLLKHSFSKLIWLVDILQILKDRDAAFWQKLSKRMEYLGQRKLFWYTLYLLKNLFKFEPPQCSGFKTQTSVFSKLERGMLKAKMGGQSLDRIGPLLLLFYIPGLKGRISFLWETIFPKEEIVEQEFVKSLNGKKISFYPSRMAHMIILFFKHLSYFFMALFRSR